MRPDNPVTDSPPPTPKDVSVHVEGKVSGQVAVGEGITQIGTVQGGEITIGQRITQFFFGSTEQQRAQRNRQAMLTLVKKFWVEGVLEQSPHGVAMIELGMEKKRDAVEHPWDVVVQTEWEDSILPPGTRVVDVFDEMGGSMLILGEPGSGKTTMLLELARDTIARAEQDPTHLIPVVFNLSSWAERRQPLADWMVEELETKYHIPKRIARPWVENDELLLLLLDGLDEVKTEQRDGCVEAINAFRREHGLAPLVVCSRVADYEALKARLQLQGAVLLQPLAPEQVDQYLAGAGEELAAVREMLRGDPTLRELARSPLMLTIMTLAYRGTKVEDLQAQETAEAGRRRLFDAYVQRMFKRRGAEQPYTPRQTVGWLAWLGWEMARHGQSVFRLEGLQPSWLATRAQRWGYVLASRLLGGVLVAVGFISILGGDWTPFLLVSLAIGVAAGLWDGARFALQAPGQATMHKRKAGFWRAAGNGLGFSLLMAVLTYGMLWAMGQVQRTSSGEFLPVFLLLGVPSCLLFGIKGAGRRVDRDIQTFEGLRWSWKRFLVPVLLVGVLLGGANWVYSGVIRGQSPDAQVWNVVEQSAVMLGEEKRFAWVDFSPDGGRIVTVGLDGAVQVWDAEGHPVALLEGAEQVRWVDFSPDGAWIVTHHEGGTVWVWDAERQLVPFGSEEQLRRVDFSPDGARIVTHHEDGTVRMWEAGGQPVASLEGAEGVYDVTFSPDGARIVAHHEDGTVRMWNAEGQPIASLEGAEQVRWVDFSPDGARIVTHHEGGTVRVWDAGGQPVPFGDEERFEVLRFSPDGSCIATVGLGDTARVWDAEGQLIAPLEGAEQVQWVDFSPDSAWIVTFEVIEEPSFWTGDNVRCKVTVWDAAEGTTLVGQTGLAYFPMVDFSPDGTHLATNLVSRDWSEFIPLWIMPGLVLGLLFGVRGRIAETKALPNQGVRLSARNALVLGIVAEGSLAVLLTVLLLVLIRAQPEMLPPGASVATLEGAIAFIQEYPRIILALLELALLFSVPVALGYGGLDVILHYVLRLILRLTGKTPWRYVRFLDYAVGRIFLRKVGGGYIFVHRLLQEYFASLCQEEETTL